MATATHAGDGVRRAAETAKERASEVAGDAVGEARALADEAREKARDLAGDAKQQLRAAADEQSARLAGGLHGLSDQLARMSEAEGSEGLVADLAREASQHVRRVAGRLDMDGVEGVVEDVRRFARNRPGAFLLGAAAAGVVAGRLLRSVDTGPLVESAQSSMGEVGAGDGPGPQHARALEPAAGEGARKRSEAPEPASEPQRGREPRREPATIDLTDGTSRRRRTRQSRLTAERPLRASGT